jgi:cob(I)alamin adenosyltransferase
MGGTGTFAGRISKADLVAAALGSIDELNSWIGVCRGEDMKGASMDAQLKQIQHNLLIIGTVVAGSRKYKFKGTETKRLERLIDKLEKELPKLHNFIFPKGYFQLVRAVARRCEREVVGAGVKDKNVLKYLNRLSDALFVVGRWVGVKNGEIEEVWKG